MKKKRNNLKIFLFKIFILRLRKRGWKIEKEDKEEDSREVKIIKLMK